MHKVFFKSIKVIFIIPAVSTVVIAQISRVEVAQKSGSEGVSVFWYVLLIFFAVALFAVVLELTKRKKQEKIIESKFRRSASRESHRIDSIDAGKEMEWFQKKTRQPKQKKAIKKKAVRRSGKLSKHAVLRPEKEPVSEPLPLPVFDIKKLGPARSFEPLPVSDEEILLSAIEQTNEEFEQDEEMRALALRILAAFKNRNSIEAISQVALYDLSVTLRAQAVSVLSGLDHESVFETMVLACADPTREVRAAAARGMFNLSFERSEAWLRVVDSDDAGRIGQCARALIAGELVKPSLERLIHPDKKYASEALALTILLIEAGELHEVFQVLQDSSDPNLRKAIVHAFRLSDNNTALDDFILICKEKDISGEIIKNLEKIRYTRQIESEQTFAPKPPLRPQSSDSPRV
jgi:HEAT repeat protein